MTILEAEKLVTRWDAEALRRGRPDKRKHLWRILDCLAGWRGYDAEVAEALDGLQKTAEVAEVRELCKNIKRSTLPCQTTRTPGYLSAYPAPRSGPG